MQGTPNIGFRLDADTRAKGCETQCRAHASRVQASVQHHNIGFGLPCNYIDSRLKCTHANDNLDFHADHPN